MTRVTYDVRTNKGDVVKVNTYAEAQTVGKIVKVNYEKVADEVAERANRSLVNFWNKVNTANIK